MPKINALPPAARAAQNDELPIHSDADGDTQKATIQMIMPTGVILDYAGDTPPDGFLLCYGQTLDATANPEYADLYDAIGVTYGGTGINDFALPDLRGRVVAGQDDMGGVSANRLTTPDGDVLGAAGGSETHTHALSDNGYAKLDPIAAGPHKARQIAASYATNVTMSGTAATSASTTTDGIALGGATDSGSTVQPTIILNKIIKY